MFNPPRTAGQEDNTLDEFVELYNPTTAAIDLFETEGGWRIADGIRFQFEPGTSLSAGDYLLLVNFDPTDEALLAAFRARYRVRPDLTVLGPYDGNLSNSGERISLEKPRAPLAPADPVVWVLMDEVIYFDRDPWPRDPDGNGPSLHRIRTDVSGNDPANWIASLPAPGGTRFGEGNLPPAPTGVNAWGGLGRIQIEWQATPTATAHRVYRSRTSGGPYDLIADGLIGTTHGDGNVVSGTTYYYVVSAVNAVGESALSLEVAAVPASGDGVILREWWLGIPGNSVSALTSHPNYPDQPSGSELIGSFEGPTNWADNYGTRIRGFLHPPATGEYTFWVAGDDNCELWLGADASPQGATLIAHVPGWTHSREWTRYAEQRSTPVMLEVGRSYYIEALHKEGSGGDNLAVAWQGPGLSQQVINGAHLSAWIGAAPVIPRGLRAIAGVGLVELSWQDMTPGTTYRVYRAIVASGPYTTVAAGLGSAVYTDQAVVNDTTYYYVVSAIIAGEEGPPSIEVSATPRAHVPVADYVSAVLAKEPIAYWRLNEMPGEVTAYDEMAVHDGIYGGNVLLGLEGPRPPGWQGLETGNTAATMENGLEDSYVTMPPLAISTDTLTITAWVYPKQAIAWGGIVFYRSGGGSATGLNLRPGGDLGYHWNDTSSSYGWDSGLTPPIYQWSLVALVVEPTQATVHLLHEEGHLSATHLEQHAPRLFSGNLRIGGDPYGNDRIFDGRIDEVALFERALSWEEIEGLYTSAIEGGPPRLRIVLQSDGTILIEWDSPGILQSKQQMDTEGASWIDHPTSENRWILSPTEAARFYRLKR
jgi:hypothetical protein